MDPDTYSVYNYQTGELLEGAPTAALVRACLSAGSEGAVLALYDRERAEWDDIPDSERDRYESRGYSVRTVFVMEELTFEHQGCMAFEPEPDGE